MRRFKQILATILLVAFFPSNVLAVTWWVDTNSDTDLDTCVADEMDNDDDCSLRDAAGRAANGDTVRFLESMAVGEVTGAIEFGFGSSALPLFTNNVTVDAEADGYTVSLDAQNAGSYSAFYVDGDGVTIKGLNIYNNFNNGIQVYGDNVTIENNRIGVKPDGSASDYQPSSHGIIIGGAYSGVTITGNTIGGSNGQAIYTPSATSNLTISNNYLGVNSGGTDVGVGMNGIWTGGGGVTISGNSISGNGQNGIRLDGTTGTNTISSNMIGVNPAGTAAVTNDLSGVFITGNSSGTTTISGNTISGNTENGVKFDIGGDLNATWKIQGNKIGTNSAGTAAVANGEEGIYADFNDDNVATYIIGTDGDGTSDATEGNVISGNTLGGISLYNGGSVKISANKLV